MRHAPSSLILFAVAPLYLALLGCSSSSGGAAPPPGGGDGGGGDAGSDSSLPNGDSGGGDSNPNGGDSGGDGGMSCANVTLTGDTIYATAPLGTDNSIIGTTYDSQFNQLSGSTIFALKGGSANPTQSMVNSVDFEWIQVQRTSELAANLKGWGLTSAELMAGNTKRYLSNRAKEIDYFEQVDLTQGCAPAPQNAIYFVEKLFFGHSYESLVYGDQTNFTAGVATTLQTMAGVSVMTAITANNLQAKFVGLGLQATNGMAVFVNSPSDVSSNYTTMGAAVPIYIGYRLVPGVLAPADTPIAWASPNKATLSIDEIDVFHNGSSILDGSTAWSVFADCYVNAAKVVNDQPVWSNTSVVDKGVSVTPGSGPQDPDTNNPTTTYGQYMGLTFSSGALDVSPGNTVSCTTYGARTDANPAIALPSVQIQVPVDTTMPTVSGYQGNFDPGNNLDYVVHYTLTVQ